MRMLDGKDMELVLDMRDEVLKVMGRVKDDLDANHEAGMEIGRLVPDAEGMAFTIYAIYAAMDPVTKRELDEIVERYKGAEA